MISIKRFVALTVNVMALTTCPLLWEKAKGLKKRSFRLNIHEIKWHGKVTIVSSSLATFQRKTLFGLKLYIRIPLTSLQTNI